MGLTKLKAIEQDTWLRYGTVPERRIGLCYCMCNFVVSAKGIWRSPGSCAAPDCDLEIPTDRKVASTGAAGAGIADVAVVGAVGLAEAERRRQ
jgi:hypothetical protein